LTSNGLLGVVGWSLMLRWDYEFVYLFSHKPIAASRLGKTTPRGVELCREATLLQLQKRLAISSMMKLDGLPWKSGRSS